MSEMVTLRGIVESVVFHNEDTGFAVFNLEAEAGGAKAQSDAESHAEFHKDTVCVGSFAGLRAGECLEVVGRFVNHAVYGRQLAVESYMLTAPSTKNAMVRYLGSGIIRGVRDRLAVKIVSRFGERTFDIIEQTPERLTEIKGINLQKAMSVSAAFHEQFEMRRVMMFLQEYAISPKTGVKIYKKYREAAFDLIKSNPYRLADDIAGVGFKQADDIASRAGIGFDSPKRVRAGVKYVLSSELGNGHVFLPKQLLIDRAAELLGVAPAVVDDELNAMQFDRVVTQDRHDGEDYGVAVYLSAFYRAETYVAKKLLELAGCPAAQTAPPGAPDSEARTDREIAEYERQSGVALAMNQRLAVRKALECGVMVITGGPGTGKTTIINAIITILEKEGKGIELIAPTGRAAKRMSEAAGREAKTIHRLLEISFVDEGSHIQKFNRNEDNQLDADVIIVDESSMVDIMLMYSLLKAVPVGARLILAGDVDQLPSVGPGNVLKDIIASGCVEVVRLTEVFRQAAESAIVMNAHRINNGAYPILNEKGKDFFFIPEETQEGVMRTVTQLLAERLPRFLRCGPMQDIQVLTPTRKGLLGVGELNARLQAALNPPSRNKAEHVLRTNVFRLGDKVMQIRNNYSGGWRVEGGGGQIQEGLGVFNGDLGVVTAIDAEEELMTVLFDGARLAEYEFSRLDELELAYGITIHKSQGSEYRAVVIPIHSGPPVLMTRNLLYTAVTRARELVVIVGAREALYRMVDNNREIGRYSSLGRRIMKLFDVMGMTNEYI